MCCRLRPLLHSFAVDLMDSAREWPRPNILAHVNVRAYDESQRERQLVVLNARLGQWGPERRQRTARLVPGTYVSTLLDALHLSFYIIYGPKLTLLCLMEACVTQISACTKLKVIRQKQILLK